LPKAVESFGALQDLFKKKKGCLTTTQSSINLKSNTMKNTMQRYIILYVLEHKIEEIFLKLTTINLKTAFAHRFE